MVRTFGRIETAPGIYTFRKFVRKWHRSSEGRGEGSKTLSNRSGNGFRYSAVFTRMLLRLRNRAARKSRTSFDLVPQKRGTGMCMSCGLLLCIGHLTSISLLVTSYFQGTNATAMGNASATMLKIASIKYGRCDVVGKSPVPKAIYWGKRAAKLGNEEAAAAVKQIDDLCGGLCANCNKPASAVDLKRCTRCRGIRYCGRDCQVRSCL